MDLAAVLKIFQVLVQAQQLIPLIGKTISEISTEGKDLVDKVKSGQAPTEAEWTVLHDQIESKTSHILGSKGQE